MTSLWTRIGFGPVRRLDTSSIDPQNRTFDIFRPGGKFLTNSLQLVGMVDPILVELIGNNRFRILSGFHRYEAAISLHWHKLSARVLNNEKSRWKAFQHVFWIKSFRSDFHPVEWAGVVRIAEIDELPPRSALQEILTPLGFQLSDAIFSLVRKLSEFPSELLSILLYYPLSFRQVERFVLLSKNILPKLAAWGDILRIRTQELLEIGEQLDEFSRQNSESDQLKWFQDVESHILDPDIPRDERLQYAKTRLDQIVRPVLHEHRQQKQDIHRRLNVPLGMTISWDENLERDDVAISLIVKHVNDLNQFGKILIDPAFRKDISKLLSFHD
jgi:hypothetical protein